MLQFDGQNHTLRFTDSRARKTVTHCGQYDWYPPAAFCSICTWMGDRVQSRLLRFGNGSARTHDKRTMRPPSGVHLSNDHLQNFWQTVDTGKKNAQYLQHTYRELRCAAHRFGSYLIARGINSNATPCAFTWNTADWANMFWVCACTGINCVRLDPQIPERRNEFTCTMQLLQPSVIIIQRVDFLHTIESILEKLVLGFEDGSVELMAGGD